MLRNFRLDLLASIAALVLSGAATARTEPGDGGPDNEGDGGPPPLVRYSLPRAEALPGSIVEVPVDVHGTSFLAVVAVSIEVDPTVLSLVDVRLSDEVTALLERVPAAESELTWIASDEEGWVQASLVLDYQGREESALPPGRRPVFVFRFLVAEGAAPAEVALSLPHPGTAGFQSRFESSTGPVYNSARNAGKPFGPRDKFEDRIDAELEDGAILILPLIGDVGIFLRGDANIDRALDVSDPIQIVTHLFLGTDDGLPCQDAADANDDGRLDISDPIAVLSFLFIGVEAPPLSSRAPAADETVDALTCERY